MNKLRTVVLLGTFSLLLSTPIQSFAKDKILSLKNLERERAALVAIMLDPGMSFDERRNKLARSQRHLTDMERMVMRDERLLASKSPLVERAFSDYESTFLVHAGAEHKRKANEQWLSLIKFSNDSIFNTEIGFRK